MSVPEDDVGVDAEGLEVGLGQLPDHRPLQQRALSRKSLTTQASISLMLQTHTFDARKNLDFGDEGRKKAG